ncbi:MAG: DNA polymerase III subunit gamma/tau [Bacteroidota bacterium]
MSDQRYLVTARKYRPQRFEEIVAQGHVSETLKNAITLDRLAHAYLFSGPRGVGKTTAARILAKAINCTAPLTDRDGGEPCRVCESCKTFEEGRSLNIIEIDAASNNRVEDIRDLRDTVMIPPQGSRKKVYIIDEVHMLSNAAFNALLKTLEEPPPYALFIFATTEPNKVLPTILSRCQRFDFRRIAVPEIVSHLEAICKTEQIQADEASLMLIAHKGDGALRDSLSAFDQAVSLCGTSLVYPELAKAFGVVDVELFFEVSQYVAGGNSAGLLQLVDRIIRQGYDLQEFLIGLSAHLRNLLVAHTTGQTGLIEAAEAVKAQYAEESKRHTEPDLLRLLMVVADGEDKLKTSAQPRLQLELTLLKMAAMAHAVDLKQALARLDQLGGATGGKGGPSAGDSSAAGKASGGTTPGGTNSGGGAPQGGAIPVQTQPAQSVVAKMVVSDAPQQGNTAQSATVQPALAQPAVPQPAPTAQATPPKTEAPAVVPLAAMPPAPALQPKTEVPAPAAEPLAAMPPAPQPAPADPVSELAMLPAEHPINAPSPGMLPVEEAQLAKPVIATPVALPAPSSAPEVAIEVPTVSPSKPVPAASGQSNNYLGLFGAPALRKVQQSDVPVPIAASDDSPVLSDSAPSSELAEITAHWDAFLKHIQGERIHVSALLQHTRPIQLQEETLVLSVPDDFHKRMLSNQQEFLLDTLCNFVMVPVERLGFVIDMMESEELLQQETASEIDPYEYMQKKRNESPIIRALFDEFGGEMVW